MFTQCLFAAALQSDYKEGQLGWAEGNSLADGNVWQVFWSLLYCMELWSCSLLSLTTTSFGRTGWQEWLFTFSES